MLAFSYIRFSSKRQAKGDSLRRQLELTGEWCERNGYTLASENYQDLGVSGWTGENWREGGLSLFLEAIRRKKVKPGTCLVVENLDRLSRDDIDRALTVFCDLLRAGIQVVTLKPERIYTKTAIANPMSLMEAILGFILANEESSKKSERLKSLWAKKRRTGEPTGALCPAWLQWNKKDRTYSVIENKADVVRQIFKMSADGCGAYAIIRNLHERKIPSIGKGGTWNHSYISVLLHHRAVIGEREMSEAVNGKREKTTVVPNAYPPILDKATWYKVQTSLATRDKQAGFRGRGARTLRNLFAGLLVDARDRGSFTYYETQKHKKLWKYIVSSNALRKVPGSPFITFPYEDFELYVLLALPALSKADFFASEPDDIDESIGTKQGELSEVRANLAVIKKRIMSGVSAATLLALVEDLDAKEKELTQEIEMLRSRTVRDECEMLDDLCDAITEMKRAKGEARLAIRQRLQGRLRMLIDKIYILLSKSKATVRGCQFDKHATVDIRFANNSYWQIALEYAASVCEPVWEGRGPTITNLPADFDKTDAFAMLPVAD